MNGRNSRQIANPPGQICRVAASLHFPDRRWVSPRGFKMKVVRIAILGIIVVGLCVCPFFSSWPNFPRSPSDPVFEEKLQKALGKSGAWIRISISRVGMRSVYEAGPSDLNFNVSAVKNGHKIVTRLRESEQYMLSWAVIDPYYTNQNDDGKKEITVTYDGSSVVKVVAHRRYEPNVVIWEGVDQSGNPVSTADLPLDSNEQQAAMRLADEFGVAVREALK